MRLPLISKGVRAQLLSDFALLKELDRVIIISGVPKLCQLKDYQYNFMLQTTKIQDVCVIIVGSRMPGYMCLPLLTPSES